MLLSILNTPTTRKESKKCCKRRWKSPDVTGEDDKNCLQINHFSPCGIAPYRKSNAKIFRIQRGIPWRFPRFSLITLRLGATSSLRRVVASHSKECRSLFVALRCFSSFSLSHFRHSTLFLLFRHIFPHSLHLSSLVHRLQSVLECARPGTVVLRHRSMTTRIDKILQRTQKRTRYIGSHRQQRKYILLLNIYLFVFQTSCCRRRERERALARPQAKTNMSFVEALGGDGGVRRSVSEDLRSQSINIAVETVWQHVKYFSLLFRLTWDFPRCISALRCVSDNISIDCLRPSSMTLKNRSRINLH